MKRDRGWVLRGAMAAVVCGFMLGGAAAQAQPSGGVDLRQQLNDLAQNPQSVQQLVGTGRAALQVGDAEAAVGFFTRALEIAPNDPRAKAGLAAATAQAGQPESALVLFAEAVQAGASEADIAGDRGLAYDLTGQTAKAQADYTLALRRGEDPEVRRRLALSLAISGQRDAALRLLDPQVRGGDRAAGRARAMVLALGGDVPGATSAAQAVMPPGAGQAMAPFFSRLASLSPAQMAAAVNLGRIPAAGTAANGTAYAERGGTTADPGALAYASSGAALRPVARNPVEQDEGDRRRPGTGEPVRVAATDAGRPRGSWSGIEGRPAAGPGGAAIVLPHPGQPFAGVRGIVATMPSAVEQQEAADPASFSGVVASAQPDVAVPPSSQPTAGEPGDGAAANLAVWNRAGPVAPAQPQSSYTPRLTAERPVTTPVRTPAPRANFSDVAATVTHLDTAPDAAPRSRYRSRRSWRSQSAVAATIPVETSTEPTSRYGSRSRRSWRGQSALSSAAPTETTEPTSRYGSRSRRSWRGYRALSSAAPAEINETASRYGSRGRRGTRGLTSPAAATVDTSATTSRSRRGARGLTSPTTTATASTNRYGSNSRRGRGSSAELIAPASTGASRGATRNGRYGASSGSTRTSGYGAPSATTGRGSRSGSTATNSARGTTAGARSTHRSAASMTTTRGGASANTAGRGAASSRATATTRSGHATTSANTTSSSARRGGTSTTTSTRRPRRH